MKNVRQTLRELLWPAALVALLLAAPIIGIRLYVQAHRGSLESRQKPTRVCTTCPDFQPDGEATNGHPAASRGGAAWHASQSPSIAATNTPRPPGSDAMTSVERKLVQQHVDQARACLADDPPRIESAIAMLEFAEARAARIGGEDLLRGLPSSEELRGRLAVFRQLLDRALRQAQRDEPVEGIQETLSRADAVYHHPDVQERLRQISGILVSRIAADQLQGKWQSALGRVRSLRRIDDSPEICALAALIEKSAVAASQPQRDSINDLLTQANRIIVAEGIEGPPPARMSSKRRLQLLQAKALLMEANRRALTDPRPKAILAVIQPWLEVAESPRSRALSLAPADSDLVIAVDIAALRKWPGLAGVINDWFDDPQTAGLTQDVAAIAKLLNVRPMGAADFVCLAAQLQHSPGRLVVVAAGDAKWVDLQESLRSHFGQRCREGTILNVPACMIGTVWVCQPQTKICVLGDADWLAQSELSPPPVPATTQPSLWDRAWGGRRGSDVWIAAKPNPAAMAVVATELAKADEVVLEAWHHETLLTVEASLRTRADAEKLAERLRTTLKTIPDHFTGTPETASLARDCIENCGISSDGSTVTVRMTGDEQLVARLIQWLRRQLTGTAAANQPPPQRP